MLPRAALEFYTLQQRVNATTANEARRLWRRMGDDLDASWRRLSPAVLAALVEAQAQVAEEAARYVPRLLAETGIPNRPQGDLRPHSLVGIASDGRSIESLAYGAVTTTKQAIGDGATTQQGLAQGGDWLDMMVKLQVADAARQATGVMTATRTNLGGHVRVLTPPSCQRCAVLGGRFYRWSTGFERHPGCDCEMAPVPSREYAEAEGFIQSPSDAYRKGEISDLTEAQKFAIDNGADIGQVVNATRGMSTTVTRRPVKPPRRGVERPVVSPGHPDLLAQLRGLPRTDPGRGLLTPEGIYREARGDRRRAIQLLREWGYIT